VKRSPAASNTASIAVTAGDAKKRHLVLQPINDTAKTLEVALTAFKHFLIVSTEFSTFFSVEL